MKLTRAGVAAGVIAAGLALAACSSSGSTSNPSTTAPDTGSTSTTPAGSSSTPTTTGDITCFSGKLNAEGSTAQANAMTTWIKAYQQACPDATINYQALGSGDGVTAFTNKQVAFAGSDAALYATDGATTAATKSCGSTPWNLPMVGGPIAIGYNLKGVSNLVLDGPTLAQIYSGKITMWNDTAIKALNPGVTLPAVKIQPFYRTDSSGTSFNVESYMAANAPSDFTATPDTDATDNKWVGQGANGSSEVAADVQKTAGGIGYFEYSYAVQTGLPTVNIKNGSKAVAISPDAASLAINSAKLDPQGKGDLSLKLDYATKTPGAYPITLVTYEIVCSKYSSATDAKEVQDFLSYLVGAGQDDLKQQGYAPLPSSLQKKVAAAVKAIS